MGAPLPLSVLRQQPQQLVPINKANPLAYGLISARLGHQIPTHAAGPAGRYMTRNTTGGLVNPDIVPSTSASNGMMTGLNAVTFVSLIRRNNVSLSDAQFAIRYRTTNVNAQSLGLGTNAFNNNTGIAFAGPTSTNSWTAPTAPASGEVMFIAGVWDKTNNVQTLYVNGVAVSTIAAGTTAIGSNGFSMYEADAAGGNTNGGALPYANLIYNRALSAAEIYALYRNIWQVWQAPVNNSLAAAIAYMLATAPTNVAPGKGSILVTGNTPSIIQSANNFLSPGSEAIGLTGYAPTVDRTAHQFLSPSGEPLAVQGYAPSVNQTLHQFLLPNGSTVGLQGYAPIVTQTNNQMVQEGSEDVLLVGYAPVITQTQHVTVQPVYEGIALAGYAPSLLRTDHHWLLPDTDSVGVTGYAPTVTSTPQPPDPRYARPIGDIDPGAWTTAQSSLSAGLKQNGGTGISTTAPGSCEVKLNNVVDPQTSTAQVVRYKAGSVTGNGLIVTLKQGMTVIAQWEHIMLPTVQTVFTQVLSVDQCDAITDYSDLRLTFEAV
jgi:hypothetical protein